MLLLMAAGRENTVQPPSECVWSGAADWTDRQTDRQTDGRIAALLYASPYRRAEAS